VLRFGTPLTKTKKRLAGYECAVPVAGAAAAQPLRTFR